MAKKYPKFTGRITVKNADGEEEIFGYLSIWEYFPPSDKNKEIET
jgi:hypothetical protein